MKWINTNGLSLLGPGSEWFWTALSAVAVVVSLLAIYRQIRLQTDVKETQQLNELAKDWESERILRLRLAVFLGIKEGKPVREIAAAWRIAGFWELVGSLARAGHISTDMISETLEATSCSGGRTSRPSSMRSGPRDLPQPGTSTSNGWPTGCDGAGTTTPTARGP